MATAKKKYKLFKICKELNLALETIKPFLEQKKIKVAGPNTSVGEEIYLEILDKFATEKEKAEKLQARKQMDSGAAGEADVVVEEVKAEESSYLKAIKQSIKDGIEAMSRPDEIEEKPKRIKRRIVPKKKIEESIEKKIKPAETKAEEKEAALKEETAEQKKPATAIKDPQAVKAAKEEKAAEKPQISEKEEASKAKKIKTKSAKADANSVLTEKEKKRRKAMEMIRKDKDSQRAARIGYIPSGDMQDLAKRRKKKRKKKKTDIDLKAVQDTVKKTLASIDAKGRKPKKVRKIKTEDGEEIEENIIQVTEFISANDLANLMDVSVAEIITKCLELGLVVSINQRLDIDTIKLLAEEYDYRVEEQYAAEFIEEEEVEEEVDEALLQPRAPIVTIMGHVDHGKTSLLDHLRDSNIVDDEAGGITQHIGAYEVNYNGKKITFLDTPGHEAFTAMRARGAQVTDIVILIIAADDAVMPQTDEALDHAKAAGVKLLIAINKIDKPGANSERIRQQLADRDVLVEEWGGSYQCAEISAKTGKGIPELLEKIVLESEMLELKANPDRHASGFVIEARLDRGKGAIGTVLIQKGTLRIGDNFVAGHNYGRVRALHDDKEERINDVGPSQPAVVVGFEGVAQAGDRFIVMKDEKTAREISTKRQQLKREQDSKQHRLVTLQQISDQIKTGEVRDLPILVKADVDGSAEALADSLINLNTEEVQVDVIRKAVGPISESDVLLASASGAVIIGFHVRANAKARELAEKENIDIRIYRVIYDAINEIKLALEGMLAPTLEENVVGQAEVRDIFKISRIGVIAGCYMTNGKIMRNNKIRLVREDAEVYSGNIASLKRFKDDVKEVNTGFECGIQIENFNDVKVGDIIEAYEVAEVKRFLA